MPEPGRRPSTGITRLLRYHAPLRLPHGPRLTISDHPGWWPRPTTYVDLARCLENLVRMLTPLPRLKRTASPVGCSAVPRRPSPSGRRVGFSEKLSRPVQGSRSFRPAHLHLGCAKDFSGGFSREIAPPDCSSGYRANRQFPGRDLHPLVFETQEVSPQSETQLTSDLPSCRTARRVEPWSRAVADWSKACCGLSSGVASKSSME
jgi:hypothetical protein